MLVSWVYFNTCKLWYPVKAQELVPLLPFIFFFLINVRELLEAVLPFIFFLINVRGTVGVCAVYGPLEYLV